MPRIRIKDILDFKTDSAKIRQNEIYPILKNIKIDFKDNYCTFTKNNALSFVKKNVPSESMKIDGAILLDEEKLFSLADNCATDFIEIKMLKDEKAQVTIGKTKSILWSPSSSQYIEPDLPLNSEFTKLYVQALSSLEHAVRFIVDENEKSTPQTSNIFINDKSIVACNGVIAFYKEVMDAMPKMTIRNEIAYAISNMPGCEYASTPSFSFFKSESTMYGFRKTEAPWFDLTPFGKMESSQPSFYVIKDEIIKFNNICIRSSKDKLMSAKFISESEDKLKILYEDAEGGMDELVAILDVKTTQCNFKYDPAAMNLLLNSIPATICYFYPGKNKYYVTDEKKSFVSLIMGKI